MLLRFQNGVFMYMYFHREIFNSPIKNVNPPEKISPRPHTCTCIFSYDHKTCYNSNIEECDTYVYTHQAHENKYK